MVVTAQTIITFWSNAGYDRWYKADPAFDEEIRTQFLPAHEAAARGDLGWPDDEHTALATVLLLDQLSRNMFRGSPRAFATDGRALEVASRAIALGFDKRHEPPMRGFFYIPFTHAEDLHQQRRGEALYAADNNADGLKWATIHREIIETFGRFPHRNVILGRTMTAPEQAFLDAEGFAG